MEEKQINITGAEFSQPQTEFLRLCNLHFSKLAEIFASGMLDLRSARAIIDFDDGGNISNIKKITNFNPKKIGLDRFS